MTLESFDDASRLYRARLDEVNTRRPLFTGDVLEDIAIPGVQLGGMGIIVAHPCAMRGRMARLEPAILVAAVKDHEPVPPERWASGYYGKTPVPDLLLDGALRVGLLDELGRAQTENIRGTRRLACMSELGLNILQQRLVWHLTRFEVPTHQLYEASAHTIEEAELMEDWSDTVCDAGWTEQNAAEAFERFVREDRGGGRTYQGDLRDPQLRPSVRAACRAEARRLAEIGIREITEGTQASGNDAGAARPPR